MNTEVPRDQAWTSGAHCGSLDIREDVHQAPTYLPLLLLGWD